jgi:multidrug efflux system outer membrane protein
MSLGRALIATASLLLVSGCVSARKPDVALPAAFEAPTPGPAGAIALDRWWTAFNDPELTGLIDQALAANTDVRTAAARLAEVRAARQSALLSLLPQGSAVGQGRKTHTEQISGTVANIPGFSTSGESEAYSGNFNVSWEVDLFGRIFATAKAARGDLAAARFAYEGSRAAIAAQVADAWFQARGLAIQLADARETARIQQELYDVASRRGAAGITATSEADRIAGDLSQARAQIAGLEADLQAQRRTILILAGRVTEPTANVSAVPNVGTPPPVPAAIPAQLLERRPDVREARARVTSARGRLDYANLAILPTINFTPGLGWSKQSQPGFSSETQNWSIGGAISQPILNIPKLLADARAEGARTEQAVIAYEKAVQTAFGDTEAVLVRLDADHRRVALLTDGEARARRAYDASRTGYTRGLTDLQTTLSAEQSWRATRTQLTAAQVQQIRRTVQAYQALGGGWPVDQYAKVEPAQVEPSRTAR